MADRAVRAHSRRPTAVEPPARPDPGWASPYARYPQTVELMQSKHMVQAPVRTTRMDEQFVHVSPVKPAFFAASVLGCAAPDASITTAVVAWATPLLCPFVDGRAFVTTFERSARDAGVSPRRRHRTVSTAGRGFFMAANGGSRGTRARTPALAGLICAVSRHPKVEMRGWQR